MRTRDPLRGYTLHDLDHLARLHADLARGLAAAAFQPGGISVFGRHWCVDHAECVAAEAAAQQRIAAEACG